MKLFQLIFPTARYFLLLLFAFFTFFALVTHAQEDRKVAVFDPEGAVEKTLLEIVREEISSVVVNTPGYTVLERQLINKVLEENKFQEGGLVDDSQVSDIGRRMGADYVFVSTISKLGNNYYISCKMIEVTTARIDRQYTGTTQNGMNDITTTTQYIVRRLFGENVELQVVKRITEGRQSAATEKRQTDKTPMDVAKRAPTVGEDNLQLLMIVKKTKVFYHKYKPGEVGWFDPESAKWYISHGLARTYFPEDEVTPARIVNKKVIVEFVSRRNIKHHLGSTIYQKGDVAWFNDDIGRYYVKKKVAIYR
jgi:hypothetical protein